MRRLRSGWWSLADSYRAWELPFKATRNHGVSGMGHSLGSTIATDLSASFLSRFIPVPSEAAKLATEDLIGKYLDEVHEAMSKEVEACGS